MKIISSNRRIIPANVNIACSMGRVWLVAAGWLIGISGLSQNLVPNPSFEEFTTCPSLLNQTILATGWGPFRDTPDFFHSCSNNNVVGVPVNFVGMQVPATGQGYFGSILWCNSAENSREHFGTELITPLIPGEPVFVSFKVSTTTAGNSANMRYSASGAGLFFSTVPYFQDGPLSLPDHAAVVLDTIIADTTNWHIVSGVYVPDSAYRFVVLGGFFSDSLLTSTVINPNGTYDCAYSYFDDICVSTSAGDCLIPDGIHPTPIERTQRILPNPCSEFATVWFKTPIRTAGQLFIYDSQGRLVMRFALSDGQRMIVLDLRNAPDSPLIITTTDLSGPHGSNILIHVSP